MRSKRAWGAAGVAAVLTAACGQTTTAPAVVEPTEAPPSSAATPDPSSAPVVDDEHAVDPPGKLRDVPVTDDILIVSPRQVPDEALEAITKIEGVTEVESLTVGQVSVENEVLNVAAVDPATYRRFTPEQSAELQEQWDRVAGGELAISPDLRKRLPVDDEGFVELAIGEGGQRLHVGAYAPQAEQIDAVVNEKWGETFGMQMGNAVLVSTGISSPQSVRKPIEKIAGENASVQELDAVAQYGLDPDAFQVATLVGTFAEAVGTFNYTSIGGGRIAPEPSWVSSHIATAQVPILGSITCNKAMIPQLQAALAEVQQLGLADTINPDEYAGCYYPRFIAGSTTLSNHSFGLALDLNVPGNQRGTVGEMDRGVVAIFKKWGFAWGGDWRYTDPMHFELNRIVNPGS